MWTRTLHRAATAVLVVVLERERVVDCRFFLHLWLRFFDLRQRCADLFRTQCGKVDAYNTGHKTSKPNKATTLSKIHLSIITSIVFLESVHRALFYQFFDKFIYVSTQPARYTLAKVTNHPRIFYCNFNPWHKNRCLGSLGVTSSISDTIGKI